MTFESDAANDIVWPDDLLDADDISVDDRAGSQTSGGWNGLQSGTSPKNESTTVNKSVDLPSTNEYWDHDDRDTYGSSLRSVSPPTYAMSEEDTDKWMHDKFDLLKIGPPPGLGVRRSLAPETQYGSSGHQGHHQQYQSSRRGQPRVLEVPRPAGLLGYSRQVSGADNGTFSHFPDDELRPATKTPWPEDVRGDDIEKWGWPEDSEPHAGPHDWEGQEAAASAGAPAQTYTNAADTAQPAQQAPTLSFAEQQNLRQVNQRNDEMAAIIAQLRLQEQIQYANRARAQSLQQQSAAPAPGPVSNGIRFANNNGPGSSMLGLPMQMQPHMQPQNPSSTVQYQLPSGSLISNLALHQQLGPTLGPTSPTVRPSISHLFHAQNQSSQQSRPPVRPNQFPSQSPQLPTQAGASRPLDRTGAGYLPGSRRAARLDESRVYPLKPGHLKKSQSVAPSSGPSPAQAAVMPAAAGGAPQAGTQPPKLPGLVKRESKPLAIVDPKTRPAAAELASAGSGSTPSAGKAGKRAIAIVDPHSKQELLLPVGSASGNQLTRTDSNSSAATSGDKPGKKLLTIVDPNNKQPVQLPVKSIGASHLARSSSSISAASTDSNSQPVKRTIAIVDPQNKQPIMLPGNCTQARQSSTSLHVRQLPASGLGRTKAPIAIVDPTTSAQVQLPAMGNSSRASKAAAPWPSLSRPVRAKKPLAIVDPATRADPTASTTSHAETSPRVPHSHTVNMASAEMADDVICSLRVTDDNTVLCSLTVAHPGMVSSATSSDKAHSNSSSHPDRAVLELVVHADAVRCRITGDSAAAGSKGLGLTASQSAAVQ